MVDADIEQALRDISAGDVSVRERAVKALIDSDHQDVEATLLLLSVLDEKWDNFEVAVTASRILVERNPDRDPAFLTDFLSSETKPAVFFYFGFPRLRRLSPVLLYASLLDRRISGIRLWAVIGLGDTADLSALDPLTAALADPNASVRAHAADAVRRLRHAGAVDVLPKHPVRARLIECLGDRRKKVRIAAARSLGSMGLLDPVRVRRSRSRRDRREFDRVLNGDIPPLPKIWIGDKTT